ncbi:uncharacterized protein LOC135345417 [Halichondria panicea]|uniref:uncharacterized protein LOC135345417 n=1 Tax=Halichondria panicea TaxID=6063 RepID=UPI00312BA317
MAELNKGYEALVSCHEMLVSEIAQDPKQMAVSLFQHRFILEDTKAKINELDRTRKDKAILLVDDIENKVKSHPEFYETFLLILGENELLYCDLVESLLQQYEKYGRIEPESKHDPLASGQRKRSLPSDVEVETLSKRPKNDVTVQVDTFEERLLKTFRSGEFEQAIEILSQAESQSIDLRDVSDADGKTLLHLACRKNWVDWYHIVYRLVEKYHCDVAAVDEDGNTLLHEAYQCGNLPCIDYLLTLPTCNPDAINKHEQTVLRMALEVNDELTVRKLLETGRVDLGQSRSYVQKLLAKNPQSQPQSHDGSAPLQGSIQVGSSSLTRSILQLAEIFIDEVVNYNPSS